MFVLAAPIPTDVRAAHAAILVSARDTYRLKLETVAGWMGIRPEALYQMEHGVRRVDFERVALLSKTSDRDARDYAAFVARGYAQLCGVQQTDELVVEVVKLSTEAIKLFSLVKSRMARAELKPSESERRIA